MDVVSAEADEIDEQEHDGETQVEVALFREIEAKAEKDRHRYPTEVEDACPEIHECTMMLCKVFVRSEYAFGGSDAEQGFLCFVQILYVNRIHLVVRHDVHPVVGNGKEDEGKQGDDQLLGLFVRTEQDGNQRYQQWMLRADAYEQGGNCQPDSEAY